MHRFCLCFIFLYSSEHNMKKGGEEVEKIWIKNSYKWSKYGTLLCVQNLLKVEMVWCAVSVFTV